ncbi:hypothetical protein RY831_12420 [Noviherbaspirillum sp. CPCC 100848]|uniref:Uncharacterized protein n=1 Tax=Noviherbaspirillum album TaxID=3080276 RepID=A0ABU6J941_9BURK|nr:hypothetical protein [Noviherbaspirillum sp. CPCC 100848]MEC4719958.1 hypothetical protein [Noviherbaspirillum sp. CPCC 100848]
MSIQIDNLPGAADLDKRSMARVRGGNSWLAGLGPIANVNVGVNQNLTQLQNVEVNTLNNVGSIGAGFLPPKINVSPSQFGALGVIL